MNALYGSVMAYLWLLYGLLMVYLWLTYGLNGFTNLFMAFQYCFRLIKWPYRSINGLIGLFLAFYSALGLWLMAQGSWHMIHGSWLMTHGMAHGSWPIKKLPRGPGAWGTPRQILLATSHEP